MNIRREITKRKFPKEMLRESEFRFRALMLASSNVVYRMNPDWSEMRQLLEMMLAKWGYEVVVARNGNEAYQILLSENAPRLAILDWKMPGMEERFVHVENQYREKYGGEAHSVQH